MNVYYVEVDKLLMSVDKLPCRPATATRVKPPCGCQLRRAKGHTNLAVASDGAPSHPAVASYGARQGIVRHRQRCKESGQPDGGWQRGHASHERPWDVSLDMRTVAHLPFAHQPGSPWYSNLRCQAFPISAALVNTATFPIACRWGHPSGEANLGCSATVAQSPTQSGRRSPPRGVFVRVVVVRRRQGSSSHRHCPVLLPLSHPAKLRPVWYGRQLTQNVVPAWSLADYVYTSHQLASY